MKFGQSQIGWMGLVGKHRISLPAGQTFMRSFGVSATVFLTPTYTVMSSSGTATVNFIGSVAGNATMASTGAATVSFVGFGGSGGGGTTGQPMGLLLALTYSAGGASSYLGQVATRSLLPDNDFGGSVYMQFNSRTGHFTTEAVTSLQVRFPHFLSEPGGETAAGIGTNTIFASIEYPAGTMTQVKWSAATSTTMIDGSMSALSDAVSVSIPANTKFWVRTYQTGAIGSYICDKAINAMGDGYEKAATGLVDKTMSGTVASITDGDYTYFPCAIVATTVQPAIVLIGDSRFLGFAVAPSTGDFGEVAASIASFGYINMGTGGDTAQSFVAHHTNRLALAGYCSHVIVDYGINDLNIGRTDAQLRTDLGTILGYFPSSPVSLTTMPPVTTSTDSWATTANQTTASYNADRVTNNGWRRSVPAGFAGCFEVADVVESARDSGKWKVDGSAGKYTPDGVHERQFAIDAITSSGNIPPSAFHRP